MVQKRLRIGFLAQSSYHKYQNEMLSGVLETAVKYDVDIIRLTEEIDYGLPRQSRLRQNRIKFIADSADSLNLDGLLILGWIRNSENIRSMLVKSVNLPIVMLGVDNPQFISVYQDGKKYIRELLVHLIEVHKRKKIVYVEPFRNDDRKDAYAEIMHEFGLFNQDLIYDRSDEKPIRDNRFQITATRVLDHFIKDKRIIPDAIMSMHADEAIAIIRELQARHLRVPEDVSVTGWEESDLARFNNPPLTTVYYPFYEIGLNGTEVLIKILKGETVERQNQIGSRVITRKSCGCIHSQDRCIVTDGTLELLGSSEIRELRHLRLEQFVTFLKPDILLSLYEEAIKKNMPDIFTRGLEMALRGRVLSSEQVSEIQEQLLSFHQLLKFKTQKEKSSVVSEEIWVKTLVLLNELKGTAYWKEERNHTQAAASLEEMSSELITGFNMDSIKQVLVYYLPLIGINRCLVYKVSRDDQSTPTSELLFSHQAENPNGTEINIPNDLITNPDGLFFEKRITYIMHPVHAGDAIIGCVLFEYGIEDDRIYRSIASSLSSAIRGTVIMGDLKDNIAEKDMLMKELQHRVKNNMMMIVSLLHLERNKLTDEKAKAVFDDAGGRIESMLMVYEKLYKPGSKLLEINLDEYIKDLSTHLLANYTGNHQSVALNMQLDRIKVDMKRSICLGLVLNELITNSIKYAFPSGKGIIRIQMSIFGKKILLIFSDNGIGLSNNTQDLTATHFGFKLITMNVQQIEGTLVIGNGEKGGLEVRIEFPLLAVE